MNLTDRALTIVAQVTLIPGTVQAGCEQGSIMGTGEGTQTSIVQGAATDIGLQAQVRVEEHAGLSCLGFRFQPRLKYITGHTHAGHMHAGHTHAHRARITRWPDGCPAHFRLSIIF